MNAQEMIKFERNRAQRFLRVLKTIASYHEDYPDEHTELASQIVERDREHQAKARRNQTVGRKKK